MEWGRDGKKGVCTVHQHHPPLPPVLSFEPLVSGTSLSEARPLHAPSLNRSGLV